MQMATFKLFLAKKVTKADETLMLRMDFYFLIQKQSSWKLELNKVQILLSFMSTFCII